MRRGFPSLARLVREGLNRDPHAGDLYVFQGRRGAGGSLPPNGWSSRA
ncbi:MAG: IS66 family insertion sequence element accessory protein TnpB [Hyphomicrobiales bacterium]|nr:IS66 family insertion sequence element accessory protein TnpB [Hyphomicrobiales bacterium]